MHFLSGSRQEDTRNFVDVKEILATKISPVEDLTGPERRINNCSVYPQTTFRQALFKSNDL